MLLRAGVRCSLCSGSRGSLVGSAAVASGRAAGAGLRPRHLSSAWGSVGDWMERAKQTVEDLTGAAQGAADGVRRAVGADRPRRDRMSAAGRSAASAAAMTAAQFGVEAEGMESETVPEGAVELSFPLQDGTVIAGRRWGPAPEARAQQQSRGRVLMLHGWIDNLNTFDLVAPQLAEAGLEVVGIDFPGHGRSSHNSKDGTYIYMNYAVAALEVAAQHLHWDRFSLLGHSMGGGVSLLISGAFPELIESVAVIEPGVVTQPAAAAPSVMRAYVHDRIDLDMSHGKPRKKRGQKQYPTLQEAITARIKSVDRFPGDQYITQGGAFHVVQRGTVVVGTNRCPRDENDGPVKFRHDARLYDRSPIYLSEDQIRGFFSQMEADMLLIRADRGWPVPPGWVGRLQILRDRPDATFEEHTLAGSHHLHIDPDTAQSVADLIVPFLSSETSARQDGMTSDGGTPVGSSGTKGNSHPNPAEVS